jgi:hypothetical protein
MARANLRRRRSPSWFRITCAHHARSFVFKISYLPMPDRDSKKSFNTLRGFINGEEPDEPIYFAYSATLRIFGDELPLDEITCALGVQPTRTQRKGGRPKPTSKMVYRQDAWRLSSSLPETEPLHRHIDEVWTAVKAHAEYLKELKRRYTVDVFCGYRSNCDHAGIEVPASSLEMFTVLEIPLGISIIIA